MPYGTDAGTMNLAFGGQKSVTPDIVTEARKKATTIVNGYLNRSEDFTTVPDMVNDATDWIAAEYIKNRSISLKDMLEMAAMLLETVKDDLNVEDGSRWGNVRFV